MISFIPEPHIPQLAGPDPLLKASGLRLEQIYCDISKTHPGWEIANKYSIHSMEGDQVYYAFEDSCRCVRYVCSRNRPFIIHIVDKDNKEVMRLYRDFKCCNLFACRNWFAGCSKCCANEIIVESPVGTPIGRISQKGSFWKARYEVLNACDNPIFDLIGPCQNGYERFCFRECNTDYTFYRSGCSTMVGKINKSHDKEYKCCVSRPHKVDSCFSSDLNANEKKLIVASMFLVELLYYDKSAGDNRESCC